MNPRRRRAVLRYGLAVAAVAVGLVSLNVPALKVPGAPVVVLLLAVLAAAWVGGRGPGLVATALVVLPMFLFTLQGGQLIWPLFFLVAGGMVSHLIGALDEARRLAEEAAERWRANDERHRRLLETANEGVWVLDASGCAVYVNTRAGEMVGVDSADLLGRALGEFTYTAEGGQDLARALGPVWQGRPARFDLRLRRRDGSPRWVRVSASPLSADRDGAKQALAMLADVTDRVVAEEALRRSESRVRRLTESGMIGVAFLDAEGRVTEANDEFLRLVGRARGELDEGRVRWAASTPPEFHEQDRRMLELLRDRGSCGPFVKELMREDGGRTAVMVGATRLEGDDSPGESVSFVLDISARRRAEESVRLLAEAGEVLGGSLVNDVNLAAFARLAVPHLADLCVIDLIDSEGQIRRITAAHSDPARDALAAELERYPPALDGPSPVAVVLRTGQSIFRPEIDETTLRAATLAGDHRTLVRRLGISSVMAVPMSARGRTFGAISFGITGGARRFDAEDLAVAEELARRVAAAVDNARLYHAAREARASAEAANLAKDQFLAALSHELRTPLTPVLIGVSAALDEIDLPARVRPILEVTRRNVALEARLIDDLLDVTRISRGKLRLNRVVVDAHELIHQSVAICHDEIVANDLMLSLDLSAGRSHVEGDPARLQQVFWNLIKNAVKFTAPRGRIVVASRDEPATDGHGTRLVIEVIDSGIGIDSAVLPKIFNAFEQGDSSVTQQFGGLGLGLAISRNLAEAHGGRLSAHSDGLGHGATFRFELPVVPAPVPEALPAPSRSTPQAPGPRVANGSLRILLVEDNPDTLRMMSRLLRGRGHRVATGGGVAEALRAMDSEGPFDLIISDLGLPDGHGHELIRRLRVVGPVAAIALSGYGNEEDHLKSREAGFSVHLTKPIDFSTLEAAIRDVTAAVPSR